MNATLTRTALAALLPFAAPVAAQVLKVPTGTHPTIQSALDAAAGGTTILVAPGTYNETLDWPAVDGIRLIAERGPAVTTIDAQQTGRVVTMDEVLTRATWLVGFTITGGLLDASAGSHKHGAGIYMDTHLGAVSPTIRGNWIQHNEIDGTQWNYGAGLYSGGTYASTSSPLIVGNLFKRNVCRNGSWNYGGALYIEDDSAADVVGNEFRKNECVDGSRGYGAAIHVRSDAGALIASNLIQRNGCDNSSYSFGAGIYVSNGATATIVGNTVVENRCQNASFHWGAGIAFLGNTTSVATNNLVVGNEPHGIHMYASATELATLDHNNVWNNGTADHVNIAAGPNSLSVDPLADSAWRLAAGSPCIDAGNDATVPAAVSIDVHGDPRNIDGDLDGSGTADIGADEFTRARLHLNAAPELGTLLPFLVEGPVGSGYWLMLDGLPGNYLLDPYGQLLLSTITPPIATGPANTPLPVPLLADPALEGLTVYFQAFVIAGPATSFTNRIDATLF